MEPINETPAKGSHDFSPIQRKIIDSIRLKFNNRVRVSAVPMGLRDLDLSASFPDNDEFLSFIVENGEVSAHQSGERSDEIHQIISAIIGENSFPPLSVVEIGAIYCRMETNQNYRLLFESKIEATGLILLNYQIADNPQAEIWARPKEEFMDGRFQKVSG